MLDRNVLELAGVSLLMWSVAGCSSAPPPEPKEPEPCTIFTPEVIVAGGERLNAADSGAGLPVQVRLYQLSSEAKFSRAFFDDVLKDDATALGETVLERRELTLYPGSVESFEWEAKPDTKALGAVAFFREPRGRDWSVSFELKPQRETPPCSEGPPRITLWLDRMKIQDGAGRVQLGERESAPSSSSEAPRPE